MGIGNEMANATEFMYEKKREGKYKLAFIGMWAAYIVIPLGIMIALTAAGLGALVLVVGVPLFYCFLLPKIIYPATIRYVQIEYEYVIKGGTMTVNHVYGRKERKEWMAPTQISTFDFIRPYTGDAKTAADAQDIVHRYEAVTTLSDSDNYCAVYTNAAGEKCSVIFKATNRALQIMKFLNRNTEVTTVTV